MLKLIMLQVPSILVTGTLCWRFLDTEESYVLRQWKCDYNPSNTHNTQYNNALWQNTQCKHLPTGAAARDYQHMYYLRQGTGTRFWIRNFPCIKHTFRTESSSTLNITIIVNDSGWDIACFRASCILANKLIKELKLFWIPVWQSFDSHWYIKPPS